MFYNLLQRNNSETNIYDRYNYWEKHRECINSIITKRVNEYNKDCGSIIILGAGNCDDVDLNFLSESFSKVFLSDYCEDNIYAGIKKQNAHLKNNITVLPGEDYTALGNCNFYNDLENSLNQGKSVKDIIRLIRNTANSIHNESVLNKYNERFDIVVTMPVYTQICMNLSEEIISLYSNSYSNSDLRKIKDEFNYLDIYATRSYNDLMFRLCKKEGMMILFTDIVELCPLEHKKMKMVNDCIVKGRIMDLTPLINSEGISGAVHGIKDFTDRVRNAKESVILAAWVWHFDKFKSYLFYSISYDLKELNYGNKKD